jgi:hypothetical protein
MAGISAREREARRSTAPRARYVVRVRAMCHPQRGEFRVGTGLCRECYQVRGRGLATGRDVLPALVRGAEQRAGETIPPSCPKCRSEPPSWAIAATEARCWICGATWFLTSARILRLDEAVKLSGRQRDE